MLYVLRHSDCPLQGKIIKMDRPIDPVYLKKRRKRLISVIAIAVIVIVGLTLFFMNWLTPSLNARDLVFSEVTQGDLETTIITNGTVIPIYEEVITSPINSRLTSVFHSSGDQIDVDAALLQLDTEYEENELQRLKDEKELKLTKLNRYKIETEENELAYGTDLKIKRLETAGLKADYLNEKNIARIGGTSQESVEKARTNYEVSELKLEQFNHQRESRKRIEASQIREYELDIKLSDASIAAKEQEINKATIMAANKGTITWLENHIGSSISKGQQLVRISDLSDFKVESSVADANSTVLRPGVKAIVRYDQQKASGTVEKVIPSVDNASIKFSIVGDSLGFTAFRLNQKVEVHLITSTRKDVLMVKNGRFYNGPGRYSLYVVKGSTGSLRTVELGGANFEMIEVISGLVKGEEVIVSDLKKYQNSKIIKINR